MGTVLALGNGLEQGGAQRGREREGHQHRQHHGRHDGDGKLPVDHPGGAAKKRHGDEHRRQRERNAHQGRGDFGHRLARGLFGGQAFFAHHALDVFHHHDGVVHQQADGQHHAEHGQRVDRITGCRQHTKGAQQYHRHGNGRNQRGAEVLQKDVHDQHHQHHGFEQGLDHFFDRGADERRGVVAGKGFELVGKERLQLGDLGVDGSGHGHGVGTVGQHHAHAGAGLAVQARGDGEVFCAQLDARHVFQAHGGAVGGGLENDLLELFLGLQLAARGDGGIELLLAHGGQGPQLACRYLRVLRIDGAADV